ncbi:MAG: TniQ family protein [Cyanobacteria bacterium J06621_8]
MKLENSKPNVLLRRPRPYADEDLAGYILRLSQVNCYDSPQWIYNLAEIPQYAANGNFCDRTTQDFSKLAQLLSIEESTLWKMAFREYKSSKVARVKFFDRSLPTYNLSKLKAKVCPCCLAEKSYCRKIWNLIPLTVCPTHHCLLLDICPQCDRPIRWDRNSVNECKYCELDWRDIRSENLELPKTIPSHLLFTACGLRKLGEAELQIIGKCHPILNLELEHVISLICFIAGQLIDIGDTTGKFLVTSHNNAELHELLLSAWDYLQDFPQGFERFLEWYKNKSSHPERDTGIARDFGNFYRRLYKNFPRQTFGFLHEAFENYLATQWDGGYLNSKLGRIEMPDDCDRKFLSGVETAKLLSMKEAWVLRLVECGTLKGRLRKMGKRTSVLVERESAEAYLQNLANAISVKEVAKILGVGSKAVVHLIEHSCVQAFRGRTVDGYLKWLILPDAPVNLLDSIDVLLKKTTNRGDIETCSFDLAIRRLSGSGCSVGRFVRAILDEAIIPISKNPRTGLKQYCFDIQDVDQLVEEYFRKYKKVLNVLDVAILLGVKQEVAAFWIDRGFIAAEVKVHKHCRHRKVLQSSIKEFQTQYVTALELARQIDTSPRKIVSLLGDRNVIPVTGKAIDGGRQYLFLRREVIEILQTS